MTIDAHVKWHIGNNFSMKYNQNPQKIGETMVMQTKIFHSSRIYKFNNRIEKTNRNNIMQNYVHICKNKKTEKKDKNKTK